MPVILPDHNLCYFPVPKVACTSLKHMFFEVENGAPYRPFTINGKPAKIHKLYPSPLFKDCPHKFLADMTRLALVRDPVARVVSCYRNRVVAYGFLSEAKAGPALAKLGLAPDPTLSEFIAQLKRYRRAHRSVAHHTRPLSEFLGTDPGYFTRLYPLAGIDAFVADVSKILGQKLAVERLQTEGPALSPADLSAAETARIRDLFAEDYEIFGDWF